jgi:outer membrane protein assembly factor BamB
LHCGIVYFGAHDNNFYAIDMETGQEMWRFRAENWVGDIRPLVHECMIYFGSVDGNMYALSLKEGKPVWRFRTGGDIWSDAVCWNDLIIFGSWDCHLYAVDSKTGKEAWRFETSSKTQSALEIYEQVTNKPEFVEKGNDESGAEGKYGFVPQINLSESFYAPAVEYAGKEIYGTGKKKYSEI